MIEFSKANEVLLEAFCGVKGSFIVLPTGLPPKRDIQHHIDLVPGSILLNKLAYMMNLKETVEIERQVKELISKGLVRESLSLVPYLPC